MTDIVAKLDRWLAVSDPPGRLPLCNREMIQRARDEIVALRERCIEPARHSYQPTQQYIQIQPLELIAAKARAEALEEAARACDEIGDWSAPETVVRAICDRCAAAIRALKDRSERGQG